MGMPYCVYRTVTADNVVSNIVEILNDVGIECEIETFDNTSSTTYDFYGVKLKDSNIRLTFHCSKDRTGGYGASLWIGMQTIGEYLPNMGTDLSREFKFGSANSSLTVSVLKNTNDFYIVSFAIGGSTLSVPQFSNNSVFKFGKIKISDRNGTDTYPACSIGGTSYLENSYGFYVFKFANDGKERIITSKDAIKICPMVPNRIQYLPVSDWNIFIYPVVAYSSGQSITTTTGTVQVLSDEIHGMKTVHGQVLPKIAPLLIDGKTYVILDDGYTAVQID